MFQPDGKKGNKTYGKIAVVSMVNKYKQLNSITVLQPQDTVLMSWKEQYRALWAVNLIEEKQRGKIKGRTCAYGSPLRTYITR